MERVNDTTIPRQAELLDLVADAIGCDTRERLPAGIAELTLREIKFVEAYLRTGNATRSWIDAGGAPASAHVEASKTLKKPKVARFVAQGVKALAGSADKVAARVVQRALMWHDRFKEAAHLNDWKAARQAAAEANRADALLASILGKLNLNVNLQGEVVHAHLDGDTVNALISSRLEYERATRKETAHGRPA